MKRTNEEAAATRDAVVVAALEVFADHGYAAATLADVAERANVTRGAVYHHFADKADLFLSTLREYWAMVAEPLWSAVEGDDPAVLRVRRFLATYLEAAERDERLRRLLEIITVRAEARPQLEAGMREKQDALELWRERLAAVLDEEPEALRDGVTPQDAAMLAVTQVIGVTTTWLLAPRVCRPAEVADAVAGAWQRSVER
jgi:AcrR family transcriptional regulator